MSRIKYDAEGATAVEYGIMVALIAVVIIGAVTFLGSSVQDSFCETGQELSDATPPADC